MIYLIGSIVLNSWLILSFKLLERLNISAMESIVFNYIVCVITGSLVIGNFPITAESFKAPWFWWSALMGFSFFVIFNIIAYTAQKIGVAVASVANKLSLIIPFGFSLYLYHESSTFYKTTGIVLALLSVILTNMHSNRRKDNLEEGLSTTLLYAVPVILFVASGLLDTMIKYVEQTHLNADNYNAYLIHSFAFAGFFGLITIASGVSTGKLKFQKGSLLAGIIIGVPNYFSIWCLIRVLKQNIGKSSAIIPVNNMGIVLFSTIMAMILFREKLHIINWIGILLGITAIGLIAYG